MSMKKLFGGIIIGTLILGSSAAAPGASAANFCKMARSINSEASYELQATYPDGGKQGIYSFTPSTFSDNYPSHVTVFSGDLSKYQMTPTVAPLGQLGSQRGFAQSVSGAETYINTDFIGAYNMPYSAIIRDGRMIYAPAVGSIGDPARNGSTRVLAVTKQVFSESTGFISIAPLKSGSLSVNVLGVNFKTMPTNGIVAFTPKNSSKTLPRGKFAILVYRGKVTKTYLMGTNVRPTSGVLFQATGSMVAQLKKFTNNKVASYTMPALTKSSMVADTVAPTGYVAFGTNKIRIRAINYQGVNSYGATLYDSNFGGTQTLGAASFQTDTKGKVLAVSPNRGYRFAIAPGKYTFQVSSQQASMVSALKVGLNVSVVERFSSAGKNTITDASGRGSLLLTNGVNVEDCVGVSEYVRPRTVIGWNESGKFWVMTATMGIHYNDNGYRLGGATIHQAGEWLKELGATQAVSFDGGGSTDQYGLVNGSIARLALPENEWVRDVPVGLVFSPKN